MPSPIKKSFAAEQLRQRKKKSPAVITIAVVAVIVAVIVVYALISRYGAVETIPVSEEIKSIAVLPFVNQSADPEQEYFCNGIAEVIIDRLTHVGDLRVIDSTSSFAFRGKENAIDEIGEKLDVDAVLEGSVQKFGSRIRIIAQLIKVSDHSHLFSKTFDKDFKEIFEIQDEISQAVVEQLEITLLDDEKTAITKHPTDNTEAYELYLLGRHSLDGGNEGKAANYFQQAIDIDPNFALAYVGLANTYPTLWWFPGKLAAAEKSLELDENLAEAHAILAHVNFFQLWDIPAAEREFKKALELNPGSAEVHFNYGYFLKAMGQFENALREIEQARKFNPLFISAYGHAIHLCSLLGRYDQAMEYYNKALEFNPDAVQRFSNILGRFNAMQGNYEKAIEIYKGTANKAHLGHCYAMNGEREKAEKILNEMIESNYVPFVFAFIYVGLGDYDKTFECIEKSRENRNIEVLFIKSDFQFDPIRSDPRYEPLVKRIFYESKRESPRKLTAVTIDPAIYDKYIGTYAVIADTVTVIKEHDCLYGRYYGMNLGRGKDRPLDELYPETETIFFSKLFEYPFSFVKNDSGRITDLLMLRPDGENTLVTFKKIEDK